MSVSDLCDLSENTGNSEPTEEQVQAAAKAAGATGPAPDSKKEKEKEKKEEKPKVTPFVGRTSAALARAERLCDPDMLEAAEALFGEFTPNQITCLATYLTERSRHEATLASIGKKIPVGARVKVVGGSKKYLGLEGIVKESRLIRTNVQFAEFKRMGYILQSDLEVLENED